MQLVNPPEKVKGQMCTGIVSKRLTVLLRYIRLLTTVGFVAVGGPPKKSLERCKRLLRTIFLTTFGSCVYKYIYMRQPQNYHQPL